MIDCGNKDAWVIFIVIILSLPPADTIIDNQIIYLRKNERKCQGWTMDDNSMYIPNVNKQNYPFCRLELLILNLLV